ncbi:MAG: hypothetical protein HZC54_20400 [Verrucomicrobia bacterium]|nr:hypothetical protein [Verrucomicrobiota bacterium]
MKLDYLKDGSDDCPLIRLYEFSSVEIQRLRQSFERLANGTAKHVALDEATPVESVDGTRLTFIRDERDRGVVLSSPQSFDMILSPEGWQRCVGLLDPFCETSRGYQWLCDDVGQIPLLLSSDGAW